MHVHQRHYCVKRHGQQPLIPNQFLPPVVEPKPFIPDAWAGLLCHHPKMYPATVLWIRVGFFWAPLRPLFGVIREVSDP